MPDRPWLRPPPAQHPSNSRTGIRSDQLTGLHKRCVVPGIPNNCANISRYIGSVPVKAAVGNDVAEMAVARLAELGGKEHAVRMLVTTMGLYVVEKGSGDTLKEVRI